MMENMELNPKVSVIIPFFNRVDLTIRAIRCVQNQIYSNIELIVVNDGSTESDEQLYQFMSSIKDSIYIKLDQNVGPSEARNIGIDKVSGEYIAFLDSDDLWDDTKLSVQIKIMQDNDWEFSHTSYYRYDVSKNKQNKISSGRNHYRFPFLAFSCKIATPTVVIKNSLLSNLRFNNQLRVGEDLLLWVELSKNCVLHGIDFCLATVYVGPTTTARNKDLKNEALKNVAHIGLADHRTYYFFHNCYQVIRKALWF